MTSRHVPITDFIDQFHTSLCATAAAELQPRFKPEHRNQSQYVQHVFKQPLFPAQLDCSAALALRLSTHKDAIAVAEMSCGKTRMGVATSQLHHAKRALIVVPPHLVDKWQEEILAVLPNARVVILESVSGVETAAQAPIDPDRPFFAIMSRERAKLSYARKPAIIPKTYKVEDRRLIRYVCPHCWTPVTDKEDIPLDPDTLSAGDKCTQCKSVLWTFDPEGPRRFALGDFICRQFPFKFDLLIGDELHTLEGKGSAQGLVFANLIGKTKKVVGLTGTLSNGKSTSLFYLLWRLVPDLREMFPYHADKQWIDAFGVWEERTTTLDTDTVIEHGKQSRRRVYVTVRERPGIPPALIPYLIERCIFMKMEDLGLALPPYREQVLPIQFNDALAVSEMEEAVSVYTSRVAEKLRCERLAATVLTVCLTTNEFKEGPQYSNALTLTLPIATDSTADLIKSALQGIRVIYRDGYSYKKAGVMLTGLVSASQSQADLFDAQDRGRSKRLMSVLDAVNDRWGAGTLYYALSGFTTAWRTQFHRRSPAYTTNWDALPVVNA